MSIEQFLAVVESKSLAMRRVVDWEDPNEAYCLRRTVNFLKEFHSKKGKPNDEEFEEYAKSIRDRTYGISFTRKDESDALWRVFSPNKSGVQLKTTVSKLKNAIESGENYCMYVIGKISYEKLRPASIDGTDLDDISLQPFFIKDVPFEHEQEVRLVAMSIKESKNEINWPKSIKIPIGASLISKVTIDPRAEDWIVNAIMSYCKGNSWLNGIPVNQSLLYRKREERP